MKPAQPDPAEILQRVRQQLILAQVRIMELEDAREETGSRLGDTDKLLSAALALADQKLDEAAHSEKTRVDLQAQFAQLQHIQQATHADLEAARAQLRALDETRRKLELQLREASASAAAEIHNLKSSRSWRWTAWLRALGGKKT